MVVSSDGLSFHARALREREAAARRYAGAQLLSSILGVSISPRAFDASGSAPESAGLSAREMDQVRSLIGDHLEEFQSLASEPDREMFFTQLLHLGRSLEEDDHLPAAATIYSTVVQEIQAHPEWTELAEAGRSAGAQLAVLQGGGEGGLRSEFLIRRITHDTLDASVFVGLGLATIAARATQLRVLGSLALSPNASLWTRGVFPRVAASLLSYGVEATVFPAATRLSRSLLPGGPELTAPGFGGELASSFILLGALHLSRSGTMSLFNEIHGINPALAGAAKLSPVSAFSQRALPQVAMFMGITGANIIEQRLGLRPASNGANLLADSLVTLFQFNVAGEAAGRVLGPGFLEMEQRTQLKAQMLSEGYFGNGPRSGLGIWGSRLPLRAKSALENLLPQLSASVITNEGIKIPEHELGSNISQSTAHDGRGVGADLPSIPPESNPLGSRSTSDIRDVKPIGSSDRLTPVPASAGTINRLAKLIGMYPHAAGFFDIPEGQGMGQILAVNQKMVDLLGYSDPSEIMGSSLLDFLDARNSRIYSALLKRFPDTKKFELHETPVLRRDHGYVYCDIHGGMDEFDGHRLGFVFIQDVSVRRQTAEALGASEASNAALLRAIPDRIFTLSRAGEVLDYRNPGHFVLPHEQVIGRNIGDLPLPPDVKRLAMTSISSALDSQQVVRFEFSLPMPDGASQQNEARVVAHGPNEVVVILRDITELKEAEAARDRLATVTKASPDYITISDPQGNILYNNPAARSLLGLNSSADPSRVPFEQRHPLWALNLIRTEGLPTAAREGVWLGESALIRADGTEIPVSQMILSHRDAVGEVTHFSSIIRDLTDVKRAEQQRIALEKVETLKLVSRGLAHDTNNVLAVVLNYLSLIQRDMSHLVNLTDMTQNLPPDRESEFWSSFRFTLGKLIDRGRETGAIQTSIPDLQSQQGVQMLSTLSYLLGRSLSDLETVTASADRIGEMVARFRKITADPPELKPFDLHSILEEKTLRNLLNGGVAGPQSIRLRLDLVDKPWPIVGHNELSNVVENILFNARDAMADRSNPMVNIKTSQHVLSKEQIDELGAFSLNAHPNPGSYTRLRIQDNGSGMSTEDRTRIFEPYFSTKPKKHDGHGGIGLAIVRKLVEDTGGFVSVESQPGTGTAFDLYLPRAKEAIEVGDPGLRARIFQVPLLIVDDEESLLYGVSGLLRKHGFAKVHTAGDVPQALRLLEDHSDIGLVVFDVNLPGRKGTNLMFQLRKSRPNLPLILWTGENAAAYSNFMGDLGAAITKPVKGEILTATIQGLIAKSFQRDRAR